MRESSEHGDPSSLHGWLSEAYFGALLSGANEQLGRRLGPRASVDDPLFGPATGDDIPRYLASVATWLLAAKASFDETAFTLGADRDVTAGRLAMDRGGERVAIPVGVVAVRRPAREIVIRTYFDAGRVGGTRAVRKPLLPAEGIGGKFRDLVRLVVREEAMLRGFEVWDIPRQGHPEPMECVEPENDWLSTEGIPDGPGLGGLGHSEDT